MADFSRFGAHLLPEHFSRFDPKSLTLAARPPPCSAHLLILRHFLHSLYHSFLRKWFIRE